MWRLDEAQLYLQGQWTIPVIAPVWSDVQAELLVLPFSSVHGTEIQRWDSLLLTVLLNFCRHRHTVSFCEFSESVLKISKIYGIHDIIFSTSLPSES